MNLFNSSTYFQSLKSFWSEFKNNQYLENKTILITGATGMIGSCLIDALMLYNKEYSGHCKVLALSRDISTARERFSYWWDRDNFMFIPQNICEPLGFSNEVDYIIHCASNADPVNFARYPVDTLMANIVGTAQLLDYGRKHGLNRFLFVSSGEMYGQPNENGDDFIEDFCGYVDYANPRSCYPAGKRAAETLCQSYISQYQTDAVIVRPCHIFGPTMTSKDSRAVSQFLWNAVNRNNILLKSSGLVERSHCYVFDAAKAILQVLVNGECGTAYNISDRQYQMTIREFAQKAAEAGGCQVVFQNPSDIEKRGYSRVGRAVLDSSKLENLGWKPQKRDQSAIAETISILREAGNE